MKSDILSKTLLALTVIFLLASCSSSRHVSKHKRTTYKTSKKSKYDSGSYAENKIRNSVVASALRYQGKKYRYGGKNPKDGFDCSGFTSFIFQDNGIALSGSSREQSKKGRKKSKSDLRPGDLVFFGSRGRVSHVGIVKSNNRSELEVIHSTTSKGVRVDEVNHSEYWRSRYLFGRDIIR